MHPCVNDANDGCLVTALVTISYLFVVVIAVFYLVILFIQLLIYLFVVFFFSTQCDRWYSRQYKEPKFLV